ncbi:hypothetical protein L579_1926 [Pantoea sp. AS-PWVM4]|uniref:Uncharacterized protein n=1 Tax=Pantoea phytobeneficialis TaxID=2052056 RepID=A0AAP9KNW2_9GAMM|nr:MULTISPECIES: hypothetical protein [Pantoea]ERK18602.1 hypothetical protein L579_1926 [Pantoea sp. AS-PWVM4]MDO6406270.1 hypothetical protein [Pantoea phytobeneficialis]QGR06238.1 hypothetical protein CTZ24_07380 [Pantoea phytobeneficialis]
MKILEWLKSQFTKPKEEKSEMPDENEVAQTEQPAVTDNTDVVLAKLKELVVAAGDKAHTVIDDLIAVVKKLV